MSIYRDFMVPGVCHFFFICKDFAEILWCPEYVNLQRFYGAPSMSFFFLFTENLQRFYGAPSMSIYRDFAEILWYPEYVNLQRFCDARVCQFTKILHDKAKPVKSL